MAHKKSSDKYQKSCEIIYDMLSSRIKERKIQLKLQNKDICPSADVNLISAIIHNRRNEKKNKYLIPNGVKGTYISENTTPFIDVIAKNLKFNSTVEMLRGSYEELESYAGHFFFQLVKEALVDEDEETKEILTGILSDYIPYAIAFTYNKLLDKHGQIASFVFNENFLSYIDEYDILETQAIARVYINMNDEFESLLDEFFTNQPDTLKLNRRLSTFMTEKVMPTMEKTRHKAACIDDVKQRFLSTCEKSIYYFNYELMLSPEAIGYHENDESYYEREYMDVWLKAEHDYISRLESAQKEIEGPPNTDILNAPRDTSNPS